MPRPTGALREVSFDKNADVRGERPHLFLVCQAFSCSNRFGLEFHGYSLQFRILCQTVLAHLSSDTRLLESAKRSARIKHVIAVHPHGTRADTVGDGMS